MWIRLKQYVYIYWNNERKKKQILRKLKGLPDYKIQKQYFCYTKSFGS